MKDYFSMYLDYLGVQPLATLKPTISRLKSISTELRQLLNDSGGCEASDIQAEAEKLGIPLDHLSASIRGFLKWRKDVIELAAGLDKEEVTDPMGETAIRIWTS